MAPFHALLVKKKNSKRCGFERHCSLSSFPGCAENRGRRRFCSPFFTNISPLPLSPKTQKDADPNTPLAWILTGGLPPPSWRPRLPCLSPDRTEAGHSHRPSLPINTEAEKRHQKKKRTEERKGSRREESIKGRSWRPKEKKNRKTEEEKEKKKQRSRGEKRERSSPGATAIAPPGFPATASATASHRFCHCKPPQTTAKLLHSR